jgi:hypothetical protein
MANSKTRTRHCIGAHFSSYVHSGNEHPWGQYCDMCLTPIASICPGKFHYRPRKGSKLNTTLGSWYRLQLVSWCSTKKRTRKSIRREAALGHYRRISGDNVKSWSCTRGWVSRIALLPWAVHPTRSLSNVRYSVNRHMKTPWWGNYFW